MKKIVWLFPLFVIILYILYIIIPFFINDCDCENENTLIGYYINSRTDSINKEYVYLYADSSYIHILSYDTIQFLNCNKWNTEVNKFSMNNWSDPDHYDYSNAENKLFFISYENSKKQFPNNYNYGCFDSYRNGCIFRIYFSEEDNHYFRRIEINTKYIDLKDVPTKFYSKSDSIFFNSSVINNKIELLNKKSEINVW